MPDETQRYLTPREASRILGVSARTLSHWHAQEKLKADRNQRGDRMYLADSVQEMRLALGSMAGNGPAPEFLTPAEAAARLDVDVKTLARFHADGKLEAGRAPGGHRRYRAGSVEVLRRQRANGTADVPGVELVTPGQAAAVFRVDYSTAARWAANGRLLPARTAKGLRFFRSEVDALKAGESPETARAKALADLSRMTEAAT